MMVWVPAYWIGNGPTNLLWICDFANFATLLGLWLESPLLLSAQLVGTLFIQFLWTVDFLAALLFGVHPIGGTEYMFDGSTALWLRCLSLFHIWTVPLLWWALRHAGYDRRGVWLQAAGTAFLFPAGQLLGTPEQNLNWMWRPFGVEQTWMPPLAFAAFAAAVVPFLLYWPAHFVVRRWLPRRSPDV
jgi:hypothetical protein